MKFIVVFPVIVLVSIQLAMSSRKLISNFEESLPRSAMQSHIMNILIYRNATAPPFINLKPLITDLDCLDAGYCETIPAVLNDETYIVVNKFKRPKVKYDSCGLRQHGQLMRVDPSLMDLCGYRQKIIVPKAVRAENGTWYYVLTRAHSRDPCFLVEVCINENGNCNDIMYVKDKTTFNSTCVQLYQRREVAAIDHQGKFTKVEFKLPFYCSCALASKTNRLLETTTFRYGRPKG